MPRMARMARMARMDHPEARKEGRWSGWRGIAADGADGPTWTPHWATVAERKEPGGSRTAGWRPDGRMELNVSYVTG